MIDFMMAMVRQQALSDLYREEYSSLHLRLHPGTEVYHQHRFAARITLPLRVVCYLPQARYHDGAKNTKSQTFIIPKRNEAPASFKKALSESEQIVARLKSDDLPLKGVLNGFERGVQLVRQGQTRLQQARQCVQILLSDSEDAFLIPFTPDNE